MAEPVAAAAAVVLPAAEQPPAPAREIPFAERLAAKEKELGIAEDSDASDEIEKPAQNSEKTPKTSEKPRVATDSKEDKRSQLKTLAEELGLNVDDTAVSVAERAEHRAAMRRDKEKLQREREDFERSKALKPEQQAAAEFGTTLRDAYERGDPDAFAKALGAKDFNAFQESFIKRLADPNYNELRRLQQKVEEKEAAEKKAAEEAAKRAQGAEYQKARAAYMQNLTATCSKSANPLVAAMADDPLFLEAVYKIQEENWDPDTQSTLTVEQAIKRATRGAKTDLESELRGLHERLSKGFAAVGATAPAAATKTNGNGKKPAPKTAVVPITSNGGGGAPKSVGEMTPKEWAQYKASKFAQAED